MRRELPTRSRYPVSTTVLPNFLIIGAAKCGTTSLASYLSQHPQVFVSPYKEPNYFAFTDRDPPCTGPAPDAVVRKMLHAHTITNFGDYCKLFATVENQSAIGEASVRYLYYSYSARTIRQVLGENVKLIAILREPVSRMFSHYCMMVQFGLEPLGFEAAIEAEQERTSRGWGYDWHYQAVGNYVEQLAVFFQFFDRKQIAIFLYDELVKQPQRTFQSIAEHLEIDPHFVPDMSERGKVASQPRSVLLNRWLQFPSPSKRMVSALLTERIARRLFTMAQSFNSRAPEVLPSGLKRHLREQWRGRISSLESLLNIKTGWLES